MEKNLVAKQNSEEPCAVVSASTDLREPRRSNSRGHPVQIIYIRIVQGIHVLVIVFSLLGLISLLGTIGFSFCGLTLTSLHSLLMLLIALFLYCIGKGFGIFVKNEQLQHIAEVSKIFFETFFIIFLLTLLITSAWHGDLSK